MKKSLILYITAVLVTLEFFSCTAKKKVQEAGEQEVSSIVLDMTALMVNDVTNPPLAARFFAYAMLAGYEVASKNDSSLRSFRGRLNGYPDIPPPAITNYSWRLAAVYAMLETASVLQPSGKQLLTRLNAVTDSCRNVGMEIQTVSNSHEYGKVISKAILAYARADGYRNISNYNRYSPREKEGCWFPTPPGFFPAVEPYFNKVRPFTLDSASQFIPVSPASYSVDPGSEFYKLSKAVYDANTNLTTPQRETAAFWDCNPFDLEEEGHLQIGIKKISPGAHWMGIAGVACKKKHVSFSRAIEVHTIVAVTLMDAFMCCWDEKFRSNRIRPETVIRKFLDPAWQPLLQTPPFPEYPSGHSVISTAAAEVLAHLLGDMAFTDTVELPYGLSPRSFRSFHQAADEAALSRFYGGIHFMDAIVSGQQQGRKVGINVIKRLSL